MGFEAKNYTSLGAFCWALMAVNHRLPCLWVADGSNGNVGLICFETELAVIALWCLRSGLRYVPG